MNESKKAQEEDHEQLLQGLMGLKEDLNDNVKRVVTETGEKVSQVLELLQIVRPFFFLVPMSIIPDSSSNSAVLPTHCRSITT